MVEVQINDLELNPGQRLHVVVERWHEPCMYPMLPTVLADLCASADVAQGQNAGVSNGVKRMSYEQFLSSPGVLGQMIRRALAIPTSTVIARAIEEQRHCLTLAEERLYVNRSDAGGHTCPPPAHPQFESSAQWTVV